MVVGKDVGRPSEHQPAVFHPQTSDVVLDMGEVPMSAGVGSVSHADTNIHGKGMIQVNRLHMQK